ncbi:MAG: mercuric reductase, partial [Pseudolabrys sp.]
MQTYDAIIIGTGQAGPALAHRLTAAGQAVAVIERKFFGGTCVNTGCTPTKTLVASAYVAHMTRRAADFGVRIPCEIAVDMKAVKARKDHVSGLSRDGVEQSLKNLKGCTVYQGHARFVGPNSVAVGGEILEAKRIFINVGGRALTPPIPGLDEVDYFTNSSIMDVDFLPPHLIILGGSYIGLEFAQIYRRFGSEVSVIELAPHLIAREDEDISLAVADILQGEGIQIYVNSRVVGVAREGNGIAVKVARDGVVSQIAGSHLLMAIGRRPNTDDLGLETAGIAMDERGFIKVDDQLRTSVPGVWALGDCNGRGAFTHTSYNDFEIVAANILDHEQRQVSDRIPAYALYT